MMDVLDASVGLKWVLIEPDADEARKIRDEFQAMVRDLGRLP